MKKLIYIVSIFFVMFLIYISIWNQYYENIYKKISESTDIVLDAVIISEGIEKEYKTTYTVQVKSGKYKNVKLLLAVKNRSDIKEKLNYGDLIKITGEIKLGEQARNYKGFDYREYLKTQKIVGLVSAKEENIQILAHKKVNFIKLCIHNISLHLQKKIYSILPQESVSLCIGLLIGEKNNIPEEIVEYFKDSNLTHMLAISGAHISYIVLIVGKVLGKIGKSFSKVFVSIFLLFFMALTGFNPSATRASIMAIMLLIASLLHRKANTYINLSIASILILLSNPYNIFNIGFQLSFAGTLGILLFNKEIEQYISSRLLKNRLENVKGIKKSILDIIAVTISANIILIPIMAIQFHTISFTFIISNLLAAPFLGLLISGGFLLYFLSIICMPLAHITSIPYHFLIQIFIKVAEYTGKIPFSSIWVKGFSIFILCIYYLSVVVIFKRKEILNYLNSKVMFEDIRKKYIKTPFNYYIICTSFTIIISFSIVLYYLPKNLKIHFIDVGQGDSTLICTPQNTKILIDGGGNENKGSFDVGKNVLLPYLLNRGITSLDYVLISHFDSDHVGGILTIMEEIKVRNVIISKQGESSDNYERFKEIIKKNRVHVIFAKRGDKIVLDKDSYFTILFPENRLIKENVLNNNSIVAKFQYKNFSMLFTGDIEEVAEERICELYKQFKICNSQVLKVGHHGSKTSSTQEFLNLVKPKIALIGVGENNTFGHPNEGILKRLENIGAKIYRTDECGEITLFIEPNGKVILQKQIN